MSEASSDEHGSLSYDGNTIDMPVGAVNQHSYSPLFVSDGSTPPPGRKTLTSYAVIVPPVERPAEYSLYEDNTIGEVLQRAGVHKFLVRFQDRRRFIVTFQQLKKLDNGLSALSVFERKEQRQQSSPSSSEESVRRRVQPRRGATKASKVIGQDMSSDELATASATPVRKRRLLSQPKLGGRKPRKDDSESASGSSAIGRSQINRSRRTNARPNYKELPVNLQVDGDTGDEDRPRLGKRKRSRSVDNFDTAPAREGTRKSSRARRPVHNMQELDEDDIPVMKAGNGIPKAVGAMEAFRQLAKDDEFRNRHNRYCDSCGEVGSNDDKGQVVYCQGCTVSYHHRCLGPRNSREHLVTKIGDQDFVLQCRRCIEAAIHKDDSAPRQGKCQVCDAKGGSTYPFRARQTMREEQKAREDNDGEDPITQVPPELINNPGNVMFRCVNCYRAFHMHHLPPRDDTIMEVDGADEEQYAAERFSEYSRQWTCRDCANVPGEVDALVAWRPSDTTKSNTNSSLREDEKEYLIKWKNYSYSKCVWMSGAWVWGSTAAAMRKSFAKGDDNMKLTTEDAVSEDYLRVDIIFDVKYTNVVNTASEKIDKARIKEIDQALVKYKGLGYDDVVWEQPPDTADLDRYADFKSAYDDWVSARYIHLPKHATLNAYIAKIRAQDFATQIEMQNQPANLTGGELMKYQLEGLNWLYYQWHKKQNAILADEMGLGKTIQVIGFLATLNQHGCWPFLVVVPNSTCANWRREIKLWAPSLRVVTYFGSAEAKKLAIKHELFHPSSKDLKCHVVVTSYNAAQEDEFRRVFRGVNWIGLVVDEGQRLKSDKNLLYGALNALRVPFKLLLTGTPLQNNPRELFNLLQFLDASINAEAMEEEYDTLTKENVPRLHELLRPFFLRRTKAQVLDFLPAMAQIIVPVTLTIVQKKLYKSILAKNSELIKSIFGGSARLAKTERTNLNNILMQLRKCLCHPFVYNRDIEEQSSNPVVSHRNLVDASSKLQLLELMLPKLQERGHRVLIFSQFLNMLDIVEDFLDGLGLFYQRLDGSLNSLQKQKRIDEFNATDSPLFAFLLSTRAGGVGINLATADTVIILDPDFNPHQDIQALSRAHRIGQKKKVLVFQLTTRSTAEEKIMQIGKKKMALDHVLIEQMDADDDAGMDLESILRHGTEALFQDDTQDIRYDSQSIDKLLDRSQIEDTSTGKDDSAESQFSFARVWANDKGTLEDSLGNDESNVDAPDPSIWENILKEREEEVAREAAAREQALGRGKRKRQAVDYATESREAALDSSPSKRREADRDEDSDTDFQEEKAVSEAEESGNETDIVDVKELRSPSRRRGSRSVYTGQANPRTPFKRVNMDGESFAVDSRSNSAPTLNEADNNVMQQPCLACDQAHVVGHCQLKHSGVENCGLCGIAHFGHSRTCPHLNSVTQCRIMLEALKRSSESKAERSLAKRYIVGIISDLNRRKQRDEDRQATGTAGQISCRTSAMPAMPNGGPYPGRSPGGPGPPAGQIIPPSYAKFKNRSDPSGLPPPGRVNGEMPTVHTSGCQANGLDS